MFVYFYIVGWWLMGFICFVVFVCCVDCMVDVLLVWLTTLGFWFNLCFTLLCFVFGLIVLLLGECLFDDLCCFCLLDLLMIILVGLLMLAVGCLLYSGLFVWFYLVGVLFVICLIDICCLLVWFVVVYWCCVWICFWWFVCLLVVRLMIGCLLCWFDAISCFNSSDLFIFLIFWYY